MACAAIAYPSPVPSSTVVRPPRRIAGSRPASPYARAAPSLTLKPKLRPLTLNVSLALNVDAPCSSGGGATLSRIRRHVYSASAPSLSPSKCSPYPCSLTSSSSSSSSYSSSSSSSSNSNDLYSAPTSTSTSAADSKFACTSSPSSRSHSHHSYSYSCPASAVSLSVAADHSPYPVSLSLKSTIAHADADAPPSPPSPSSSSSSSTEDEAIYFSAPTSPASALFSPRGGNYTFSPTTPSFAASSSSFASAGAWAPPPPPLLANPNPSIRRDSGARRSPSPSPIMFFAPPPLHCRDLPAGPSRTSPLLTSPFNSIAAPRALTSSSISGTGTSRSRHPDNPLLAASPPSFSHITPHLLIGDLAFAERADLLVREGVTHVVSVLRERGESSFFVLGFSVALPVFFAGLGSSDFGGRIGGIRELPPGYTISAGGRPSYAGRRVVNERYGDR
ncbi:hypothetical protein DFH08DRAFT_449145 [Mycena albidolilacea]|uniref:Uncharacterized protein n=1 Tax=Mycena albidolilacea TaxID=1033008 RepID=A0AAD6Z841_9AGAR|nr:hypothetical protein DFH08DRAFT_449145 [Mycena albidolilacea]